MASDRSRFPGDLRYWIDETLGRGDEAFQTEDDVGQGVAWWHAEDELDRIVEDMRLGFGAGW